MRRGGFQRFTATVDSMFTAAETETRYSASPVEGVRLRAVELSYGWDGSGGAVVEGGDNQ